MNFCVIGLGSMGMGVAKSFAREGINAFGVDSNEQALKDFGFFGEAVKANAAGHS